MRLYVPGPAGQYAYPALTPALTRPVTGERYLFGACGIPLDIKTVRPDGRLIELGTLP
jgi:hypothetical protein